MSKYKKPISLSIDFKGNGAIPFAIGVLAGQAIAAAVVGGAAAAGAAVASKVVGDNINIMDDSCRLRGLKSYGSI